MKKDYQKSFRLRCVVCGSDTDFQFNEDNTYIKCLKCNREYFGGYDELLELNKGLVDENVERAKTEITRDVKTEITAMLRKSFNGSKFIKFK